MQELYIDSPQALRDLVSDLSHAEWIALDTEFLRDKSYVPQLCLIQVCDGRRAACIDPLAVADLSPFAPVLRATDCLKVLHAARQDLEVLQDYFGFLPAPVYDSQVAAALIGLGEQISYAALVKEMVGKQLEKGHARTDWSKRPLKDAQLRYALDDVIFLAEAFPPLRERLARRGRSDWLREELVPLADPQTFVLDPHLAWERVKGIQNLRGVQLAVLRALAAWRETEARARNLPRRWVVSDEVLLELARRQPSERAQMAQLRGVHPDLLNRYAEPVLGLIVAARNEPADSWPHRSRPRSLSPRQDAVAALLASALQAVAAREGIIASTLATRRELERLVRGERDLPVLRGWRRAVIGETLLGLLAERLALGVSAGAVAELPRDDGQPKRD